MLILIGFGVGFVCGVVNGVLVIGLGLFLIVVIIGMMSLFCGIFYIVFGDKVYIGYLFDFVFFG